MPDFDSDDGIIDFNDNEADGGEDLGRFSVDDDNSYVDVHVGSDFDPQAVTFHDVFEAMGTDVDQEVLLNQITIDGLDNYDDTDQDARGPYDRDEVIDFMNETGWWGIADIYFDEDTDSYYVDINYDDGAQN